MEQVTKPVEGQNDGQETAVTHGGLQVLGPLGALEGSKTIIHFRRHHDTPSIAETPTSIPNSGNPSTTFAVSRLTLMNLPIRRRMYCGSPARLGSLTMPLRLSVLEGQLFVFNSQNQVFPVGGWPLLKHFENSLTAQILGG